MLPHMVMLRARSSGVGVDAPDGTISDEESFPTSAEASITFESDGSLTIAGTGVTQARWLTGSTNGAAYDIVVTVSGSDSFSPGSAAPSVVHNLGTDRVFRVARSSLGTKSCSASYEIFDTGTSISRSIGSLELSATVS